MTERTNEEWLADIQQTGRTGDAALQDLRNFILRGILGYLRARSDMARLDPHDLQQLAEDTAQDALLKIQAKADTFWAKASLQLGQQKLRSIT